MAAPTSQCQLHLPATVSVSLCVSLCVCLPVCVCQCAASRFSSRRSPTSAPTDRIERQQQQQQQVISLALANCTSPQPPPCCTCRASPTELTRQPLCLPTALFPPSCMPCRRAPRLPLWPPSPNCSAPRGDSATRHSAPPSSPPPPLGPPRADTNLSSPLDKQTPTHSGPSRRAPSASPRRAGRRAESAL